MTYMTPHHLLHQLQVALLLLWGGDKKVRMNKHWKMTIKMNFYCQFYLLLPLEGNHVKT